ncbi:hypothetical protein FOCC_FOCC014906 [Frankliniella occidentalis]|nr:hypothetical protein FOCC_FOCC014906 [Frankliniella occidentalis]
MEESNLIVIVPTKWLTEPLKEFTRTRYPPDKGWPAKGNRSAQLRARVSKLTDADPHWDTKRIRILGKKKTYDDAMRASKVAENESNLETEPELKKRQRVIPKRFCSDSDSDEERPSARTKRRKSKNKQKRVVVIDDDSDNDGAVPPPVVKTSVLQQLKPSVPVRALAVKPVVLDTLKGLKSAAPNIVKNTGSSAVGGNSHTGLKSVTIAKLLPAGLNISKKTNSSALGKSPRELLKSVTGAPLPAKPNISKEVNSSALGKSPSELKSVTGTPLPAKPKNMNSSELGKSVTGIKSVTGAPLPAKPNKTNSSALGKSVTGIKWWGSSVVAEVQ